MEKQDLQLGPFGQTPFSLLTSSLTPSTSLFKWSEFEIQLPESHFHNFNVQQLFQKDNDSEDDSEIESEFHNPTPSAYLNHNQLESVKRRGTLTLTTPSRTTDSNKTTTFRLSPLLQKGIDTAYGEFLDSVALATGRILFVFIPKSLQHLRKSGVNVLNALFHLFDLIIGLKSTHCKDLESKINFERCKYLVAELKVVGKTTLHPLARYIQHQIAKSKKAKIVLLNAKPPPIPYKFITPNGLELDFTLFDRSNFTSNISPLLSKILLKTNKTDSWFLQQREIIVRSLGEDKMCEFEANKLIHEEYLRRLIGEIYQCDGLRGSSRLLIEQVQVWSVLRCSLDNLHKRLLPLFKQGELKKVQNSHSLLSRDSVWLKKKEMEIEKEFYKLNKFTAHENALDELRRKGLDQGAYFLRRDLYFLKETAPVLEKELLKQRQPCKIYEWNVCYRDYPIFTSSSSHHLHRLFATFIYRYIITLLCLLYHCLQRIPLDSHFSIFVLYRKRHKSLDGKVHKTLRGELSSTWRRVSKEISKHEEMLNKKKVAHGNLFSLKQVSRLGNCLKWYGYGVGMTIFWGGIFALIVVGVNLGCLVITGTCLIWPLIYTIGYHCFCILIKDLDGYHDDYKYFPIFRIIFVIFYNSLKMICAMVVIGILCPLSCSLVLLGSSIAYMLRLGYDSILYNLLIKKHGRIPLRSSFLVKKLVKSPKNYEISSKQALLIILTKLELEQLTHFHSSVLKSLQIPIETYEKFFEQYLSNFSCCLNENINGFYRDLVKDVFGVKERLDFLVDEQRKRLICYLPRDRIKIRDFHGFCRNGVSMATNFYKGLIHEFDLDFGDFFSGKGLEGGDFEGLFLNLVVEVFGMEVLYGGEGRRVPEDCDEIPLPMFNPKLELRKQFSLTKTNYELHPPYLTIDAFVPSHGLRLKQRNNDLLLNPLPLLHPVFVAVLILNREEDMVDLGDVAVRAVVRVMEESTPPPLLQQECFSLDVGSSGSGSGSGSSEEDEDENVMMNLGTSV